jgi:hypothetical protein
MNSDHIIPKPRSIIAAPAILHSNFIANDRRTSLGSAHRETRNSPRAPTNKFNRTNVTGKAAIRKPTVSNITGIIILTAAKKKYAIAIGSSLVTAPGIAVWNAHTERADTPAANSSIAPAITYAIPNAKRWLNIEKPGRP